MLRASEAVEKLKQLDSTQRETRQLTAVPHLACPHTAYFSSLAIPRGEFGPLNGALNTAEQA